MSLPTSLILGQTSDIGAYDVTYLSTKKEENLTFDSSAVLHLSQEMC